MSTHASSIAFPRPDWVMCGVQNPVGGVRLMASKELERAELEARMSYPDYLRDDLFINPAAVTQRFFLTAEMRTFIIIDAPDYPAAFRSLFEGWSPEPDPRPALSQGQPELVGMSGGGQPLSGSPGPVPPASEPDWDKIRAYGRGEIPGSKLNSKEMDLASDALDALDWADSGE